jgi:hypothetical protein
MFSFSVSDLLIITRDLNEPTADIEVYLRKRGQDTFLLFTWTSEVFIIHNQKLNLSYKHIRRV